MKKITSLVLFSLLFAYPIKSHAVPIYIEGINDTQPVSPGWTSDPMKEVEFSYTAGFSYSLAEVDFYTGSGSGDFTVRVREDMAGAPGNLLGEATFTLSGSGFQGTPFVSPVSITAGNNYWVGFYSQYETGTHFAATGDLVAEYVDWNLDGAWDVGPLTWLRPMIKFYQEDTVASVPEPSTLFLLGSGLAGLSIVRFRKRNKA